MKKDGQDNNKMNYMTKIYAVRRSGDVRLISFPLKKKKKKKNIYI